MDFVTQIDNKLKQFKHSQSGFTLIEIGIAIFILAAGLIGILTVFPIGIEYTKKMAKYSNAAILSELAMSDLKENDIVGIVGTMTAGQSYTYPDLSNINKAQYFEDSSGNIIFAQYFWQAVVKGITATDTNMTRIQIPIFWSFNPSQFGTGTANFTQGSSNVQYTPPLPSKLTSKQYIRADNEAFWYRIDDIDTSFIILEGPFLGNSGVGLAFSTTDDIIDIY